MLLGKKGTRNKLGHLHRPNHGKETHKVTELPKMRLNLKLNLQLLLTTLIQNNRFIQIG